jgi:hypothetical protein
MVMRVEKHLGDKQEKTKVKAHHCQRRFEWMRWYSPICRTDLGGYHVHTHDFFFDTIYTFRILFFGSMRPCIADCCC